MTEDLMERLSAYRSELDAAISADLDSDRTTPTEPPGRRRWMLAAAAAALVVAGVGALVVNATRTSTGSDPVAAPATTISPDPTVTPGATTAPTSGATVTDGPGEWERLEIGSQHPDVVRLEEQLVSLGYVIDTIDDTYDDQTRLAVIAFERLQAGLGLSNATGVVTRDVWDELFAARPVEPRRTPPGVTHVEIYLPEQVVAAYSDNKPVLITAASSGHGEEWCDQVTIDPGELGNAAGTEPLSRGECGLAITPGGHYQVNRQEIGEVNTSIGTMIDPIFYNFGLAIYSTAIADMPLTPSTRGGVAIPAHLAARLQELTDLNDPVFVWDGSNEPEHYGEQLPIFNWLDPTTNSDDSSGDSRADEIEANTIRALEDAQHAARSPDDRVTLAVTTDDAGNVTWWATAWTYQPPTGQQLFCVGTPSGTHCHPDGAHELPTPVIVLSSGETNGGVTLLASPDVESIEVVAPATAPAALDLVDPGTDSGRQLAAFPAGAGTSTTLRATVGGETTETTFDLIPPGAPHSTNALVDLTPSPHLELHGPTELAGG